jgi:hypothetical protein
MLSVVRRLSYRVCLILAGTLVASAQLLPDGPPKPRPQTKPTPSASVLITIALALVLTTVCLGSSPPPPAPVPPDIKFETPDPALPVEVKSLLGKWTGRLETRWGVDSVLYVEKVGKDSAQVVISWGDYSHAQCHCGANWVRVTQAKLKSSGGKAVLEFNAPMLLLKSHTTTGEMRGLSQYSYSFSASEPNSLKGVFAPARVSKRTRIRMQKVE